MFEIGNSLHEARVRQGIDFQTAELTTKIRAKYLVALEEEHFDLLPAETYVKGFLRTYAEFLGLDGQLYVDEYSSRFVVGEDEGRPLRPRRSQARPQRRSHRLESGVVLVALAAIGLVAALVIVAWRSGDGNKRASFDSAAPVVKPAAKPSKQAAPRIARLIVTARDGNSLLEVHAGSAAGELLFQGTLLRGKSQPFSAKRLWVDVAAPANVVFRLNGRKHRIPGTKARVLIVTAVGIHTASIG
jgi:cytoskeleton protein RodZ